jgi:hypothetical protein
LLKRDRRLRLLLVFAAVQILIDRHTHLRIKCISLDNGSFYLTFFVVSFVGGSFCIASRLKCQRCVRDLIFIVSSPLHMYNMLVLSSDISSSSERNVLSCSNIIHIWKNITCHYSVRSFKTTSTSLEYEILRSYR